MEQKMIDETELRNETGTEVMRPANVEVMPAATNPMELLSRAVGQGADIGTLERLMALQERYEKAEAEKAFTAAMAAFKANPPEILKNKQVEFSDVKYKHATLDQVTSVLGKALSEHGLSFRWDTKQENNQITVTCILTHVLGHKESVTLSAQPDTSGKKNSIQGVGSTVSYLQRYTLMAITGSASQDMDDDGRGSEEPELTEFQESLLAELRTASLDGMVALNQKFKDLNTKNAIPADKRVLNDLWKKYGASLKNAAQVVDREIKKAKE
jgi:hypothetical protein